jgi:anti-anti-sigma factor
MFERARQGAVDVIFGATPLNRESAPQVAELLEQCLQSGQPRAVFDLEQVPLLDSAGLEALVDAQDTFAVRGGSLKLARPNALCNEILTVTGVARRFEVFADTLSAVGSFAQ